MLPYRLTIFLGAFLMFQIEPLSARYILPWFGGTPAVWITCMLFFQLLLVVGYGYSHAIVTRLRPRSQAITHIALVTGCLLLMLTLTFVWASPITPGANWKPTKPEVPVVRIFILLSASIGLPFFILSTTGPLLQTWLAQSQHRASVYRLYALSNLGSLLALLTYPFLIEPLLTLRSQALLWSSLFFVFAIGVALCALTVRDPPGPVQAALDSIRPAPRVTARIDYVLWIALTACASVMLLATTNQICQQVAAVPFLWVLPLALYLVSFIICFDNPRWYLRGIFHPALAVSIFLACIALCSPNTTIVAQVSIYSFLLFAVCMVCHGELIKLKPDEIYLTAYYLMIAIGGAIGGIFVALVAPWVFNGYWEFNLGIWVSALLLFIVVMLDPDSWIHRRNPLLAAAMLAGAILMPEVIGAHTLREMIRRVDDPVQMVRAVFALGMISAAGFQTKSYLNRHWPGSVLQCSVIAGLLVIGGVLMVDVRADRNSNLLATRDFYGALSVYSVDTRNIEEHYYMLRHGRTVHGIQYTAPDQRQQPTSYYGPDSGVGLLMLHHPHRSARTAVDRSLRVGAIGLGIGTIAAYGARGDSIRFYEINPAVIRVAGDPNGYFSYLRDSRANITIVPGDARLSMESELASGHSIQFDILVVDAFAGDAIPVHLLTKEAMEIYLRELSPNGVIAFHVTNRYLDLMPVIRGLSDHFQLHAGLVHQAAGALVKPSDWVLVAHNDHVLGQPEITTRLRPLSPLGGVRLWTDDYSNLFQILK